MAEDRRYNILSRRDEIHVLIANNELRQATKLLLSFCRDFSTNDNLQTEALMISSDCAEYEADKRKGTVAADSLRTTKRSIIEHACELINEIINSQTDVA